MKESYCEVCKAPRGFKRNLGWGTFFAVLFTGGFWLLAIPFYPKRCIVCGTTQKHKYTTAEIALIVAVIAAGIAIVSSLFSTNTPTTVSNQTNSTSVATPTKAQVVAQAQKVLEEAKSKHADQVYLTKSDYDNLSEQYFALLPYKQDNQKLLNDIVRYRKIAFANVIEKILLEDGRSATVTAGNQDLVVKLPFVSKAIAYQLANKGRIYDRAKEIGFKRLIFKDNLDDLYVYKLDRF